MRSGLKPMFLTFLLGIVVIALLAFVYGRRQALAVAGGRESALHSRASQHGAHLAAVIAMPAIAVLTIGAFLKSWLVDRMVIGGLSSDTSGSAAVQLEGFLRNAKAIAFGGVVNDRSEAAMAAGARFASLDQSGTAILGVVLLAAAAAAFLWGKARITCDYRARNVVERIIMGLLIAASAVAVLTTIGIVLSVVFETLRFFSMVSPLNFFFGTEWSPQRATGGIEAAQNAFGLIPVLAGTMLIMVIAMLVAGPVGLFAAIYMSEYATPRFRAFAKPLLEVLAGIPTVVFGFFAALTVAPFLRDGGTMFGLHVAAESALAAGLVMGVMIIPMISSLSDDVINAVPQSLRDGSLGMGATPSETIRRVVLPAALPGIASAFMLAVSRAVGETMIVVMAAGLAANLTANPLEAVTTITVQIKTMLIGDQEFNNPKTLSAFALGFVLFFFTLALNVIALRIVRKYREAYD
jgi:phosphate transport system permease protein